MKKITVSEHEYITTTPEVREQIRQMAEEFSTANGIDWQYDYRWMTMTDEAFLMAKLKYDPLLSAMTVRSI